MRILAANNLWPHCLATLESTSAPTTLRCHCVQLYQPRDESINIVRDSALAVVVGLIPILGLIYIVRLVQWYQLNPQIITLHQSGDISDEFAVDFSGARVRLWVAVLMWPAIILAMFVFIVVTLALE